MDQKPPPWLNFAPWLWPWHFGDVLAIGGLGILCLPVLGQLMPYLEESRTEARITQIYGEVRRLAADAKGQGMLPTPADRDPWGQPYRVVTLADNSVRIVSCGPNEVTLQDGLDEDDIYSDMPVSPAKAILQRKRRQIYIAVNAAAGLWIVLSLLYVRSRFWKPLKPR